MKLAVIGHPISHTLSPSIHGAILGKLNIPHEYKAYSVEKGEIGRFIQHAENHGLQGFNVTMPHKQDIIPFLDKIHPDAILFNSVNTVKLTQGVKIGYNTDGEGFSMSLQNAGYTFSGARVVVLGAGGAAATIVKKAEQEGAAKIVVLNRNADKGRKLSRDFDTLSAINEYMETCDILINATPLGMHGTGSEFDCFDFVDRTRRETLICDLIYNPQTTALLRHAKKLGRKTLNGLNMLIYQALLADEIFMSDTHLEWERCEL